MARGKASGYALKESDIPIVLGMLARGDRDHDVAGWFGVNQGRIADAKEGKWGTPAPADANALPPAGPPGIKGRRLRSAIAKVAALMAAGKHLEAVGKLQEAMADYDRNEA